MATNTKGIYYRTNTDAAITEEARSLALANSVPVGPNYIINGAMDIWQRGDSHSSLGSAPYTADRWQFTYGSGSAGTVSRSTDVPADAGVRYSLSMAMTSSQDPRMIQKVESINAAPLANKVATLSFWAKSTVGSFVLSIFGQVASATDNWSSVTNVMYQDITLTSSWQRFSVTATMPSTIVNGIQIVFLRGSTAGSASTTLITGVQLEEGSYATPFRRNAPSIQAELATCQRYYYRYTEAVNYAFLSSAMCWGGNEAVIAYKLPVTMRARPSASISNLAGVYWLGNGTNYSGATAFNSFTTPETWGMYCTITIPANTPLMFRLPINSYIEANAEL